MSVVLFHRNFQRLQGGHLKVFHYFEHVRSTPAHEAWIRFTPDSVWDAANPWAPIREELLEGRAGADADVLFLAGMDWRRLAPAQREQPSLPVINLIQYMPRAGRAGPLNQFLAHPAVRVCVSPEIQEALHTGGGVEGPIFTIPIGVDLEQLPPARAAPERDLDCIVLAVKDAELGEPVAERLIKAGHSVLLVEEPLPRRELLEAMARAHVTVHLPARVEGAYLPALESMALGAAVVCPDCVGNRSFCRDGDTCLVPARKPRAIANAALTLLNASPVELEPMLGRAREESMKRTLSGERRRFLELLGRIDAVWGGR